MLAAKIKMTEILIVEDEKNISNLIKMALSQMGYMCDCAYDGESGADMIEHKRYDIILPSSRKNVG